MARNQVDVSQKGVAPGSFVQTQDHTQPYKGFPAHKGTPDSDVYIVLFRTTKLAIGGIRHSSLVFFCFYMFW